MLAVVLTGIKLLVYALVMHGALARPLCQWDCRWYLSVAAHGYDTRPRLAEEHQANWAFFPLLPLLVRGAGAVSGFVPVVAGTLAASLCLIGFLVIGARYRQVTRPGSPALPWLLLVTAWPYGFYFHAVYSESLYAALTALSLLLMVKQRPIGAGIGCGLLSATRPTGILLSAAFGLDRLWRARTARRPAEVLRILLPAAIAPVGLGLFMVYLWRHTGDPLAFAHIQSAWHRRKGNPLGVLEDGFASIDVHHHHFGLAYEAGWGVLGLLVGLWLAWRGRWMEGLLCAGTVLMALSSGSLWSMPRFVAAGPALLFAAGDLFDRLRGRSVRLIALALLAAVQILFVIRWAQGANFLM